MEINKAIITGVEQTDLSLPVVIKAENRRVNLVEWAKENISTIEELILNHGGVLFRNFRVNGTAHFERFIEETFEQQLLSYSNRSTPRTSIKGRIYSSTEYPNNQAIPLHNENSYSRSWAQKIFFYCVTPSPAGGQTPIADSRIIYNKIPKNIRRKFNEKGLLYVRNYSELDLPWQEVFQTSDKASVEEFCKENMMEFEWLKDDGLRTKQLCQAVEHHPITKEPVWFNQAHLFHLSNLDEDIRETLNKNFKKEDLPRNVYYGDGSDIDSEDLSLIREIYKQEEVVFQWKSGDILLLDNMLSAHGRRPFEGPRKVLVGMISPYKNKKINQELAG